MNTCGTCKYLGEIITRGELVNGEYVILEPIHHVCDLVKMRFYKGDSEANNDMAYVVDGSGYYAALCVKDDFGCNQWAAKE